MTDLLEEAGIVVTLKNKKRIDQVIHGLVRVKCKKCMLDFWAEVKKRIGEEKSRRAFIAAVKKTVTI